MPKASVKRLIDCKKEQLIDLVLDIEKYPEFVPFCLGSKIYEKKDKGDQLLIIADLTIGKGPLKHLENKWHFKEINNLSEVSFEIDFELKNDFLNIIMSNSFQFGLNKIADSFQKRAEELFSKA